MKKIKNMPIFHPNAPRKLVRLWRTRPAFHRIATHLLVNVDYVYQAMMKGKEPRNEIIRVKFGLSRKPKPKTAGAKPLPNYMRWWMRLDNSIRMIYIREIYLKWSAQAPNDR
jgi:hypothetical protein